MNLLFICSKNRLRSPTAEQVFADWPGVTTASAGINHDADTPVSPELLEWADLVLVMEPMHRRKLASKFRAQLGNTRVVSLGIPDDYQSMQPELVELLKRKVAGYLP